MSSRIYRSCSTNDVTRDYAAPELVLCYKLGMGVAKDYYKAALPEDGQELQNHKLISNK
jgi:hypothetical protein